MDCSTRAPRVALMSLASAVLVLAAGCSKPPVRPPRAPVSVAVTQVRRMSMPYTVEANGTVTPLQTANVASQVDGIVTDVLFQEGQEVTKGQLLFKIDPRPYQATYQQVQAALARDLATFENAQGQFERYDRLLKSQVVTQEQVDQMRATAGSTSATVLADSANLATAKFNLDNTTIKAPISGRTGGLLVRPGNLARAAGGTAMVVINQVRPILVRFSVPGSQLPMILHYGGKGGLPVRASPSSSGAPQAPAPTTTPLDASATNAASRQIAVPVDTIDPPAEGTLFFIDNAVDTTTGTVQLKAKFDNRSGTLWAGQFVAASLRLFVEEGALVVPAQCVVTGQKGTYVYVIDSSNTAEQRPVTVERSSNGITVIASGLSEGERVVTEGMSRLAQGAPVDLGTGSDSTGRGGRGGRGARGGGGKAGGRGGGKAGGQGKTP
jgi:multidrug efflux system membrane fusion protein